jgi:isoamylase
VTSHAATPSYRPTPPLGVHLAGDGVDVAVLAGRATAVDLCLLDRDDAAPLGWRERRVPLEGPVHGVWYAHVPGVHAGQHYGFRTHGDWDPARGLRHNPAKLLVDPYARGLVGTLGYGPDTYGYVTDEDGAGPHDGAPDPRDSVRSVPHGVVVDTTYRGERIAGPGVAWESTVVYEAHVRGLTKSLPGVPEELRGTYAGLAHPATIDHLLSLGVTALELLPVHAFASEPHLVDKGLTNYWGYNTLGFFAPHAPYATAEAQAAGPGAVLAEVTGAVQLLHAAGLEVLLDVVYNHTCEGGDGGQHVSWRGLDTGYYLHDGGIPARFADVTGCGNSLDFRRPRVVQMALDSLRYWVTQVGVDGFRFDLAVTLGRTANGFDPDHPFLVGLATDPVLRDVKLIAEPWDVGPGGWRTGSFPAPMGEWNDRFRNAARTFWLTDPSQASHGRPGHGVAELATRLAGSVDLFGDGDPPLTRGPVASVNYVTAHDGFTLADLVAYDHKHNEANGEHGRDGTDDNRSWNHGVEGPVRADSPGVDILPLRRRSIRNLLGTLLLSAGTPMITAGDEIGRTQGGNNNAYCQDGPVSWVSWELSEWRRDLLSTARYLLLLRRENAALHAPAFFRGRPVVEGGRPDLAWFAADGGPLDHGAWHDPAVRTLQMLREVPGSTALLVLNGSLDPLPIVLADDRPTRWELAWDSAWEHPGEQSSAAIGGGLHPDAGDTVVLEPLSLRLYLER